MRSQTLSLVTLLTLVATLTISDFPLIQTPKSKMSNAWALAQAPLSRKAEVDQLLQQGTDQYQTSQFEAALQSWQQALRVYREIKDRLGEEKVLLDLGRAYLALGNHVKASEYLQQSLVLAREISDRSGEAQALNYLGQTLLQSGNLPQAERIFLQSIQVEESLRTMLRGNDASKLSMLDIQASSYRQLQKTLVAQNKTEADLEVAERGRARAFVELLRSRLSSQPRTQNIALQQSSITPPTVEDIKRIAKEHQSTLVSYSIIDDNVQVQGRQKTQESQLYIWVVPPSGEIAFRRVDLNTLGQQQNTSLSDLITSTRESIGLRRGETIPKLEKHQIKADQILAAPKGGLSVESRPNERQTKGLQQLYQLLIQPIADLLPSDPNARVVFIPQDSLFLVPFAMLQDASGKYLIEQHSILTAPSIQVLDLTRQRRQRVANGDILVVGNPSMPSIPPRPGEKPQPLPNLPGAEQEARAIAQLFNTQALTGKDATKAAVLERMPGARIIHLATSAIVDEELGIGSALALAPSGNDNGWLTAEEILNLKLNADLVVLSGCNTGLGKITGDGVIGLARSFIAAGTSSVIVSLGYVSDEATALFMAEFYRNLQQNQDKAQALRSAMLAAMKKYPNHLDWGAFTLIGEAQ